MNWTAGMLTNVRDNPLSYGLAFAGALVWAAYCTVTARIAGGANGVTLFFMLVSASLWIKYLLGGGGHMDFSGEAIVYLALATRAAGAAGAARNFGTAAVARLGGGATVRCDAFYVGFTVLVW